MEHIKAYKQIKMIYSTEMVHYLRRFDYYFSKFQEVDRIIEYAKKLKQPFPHKLYNESSYLFELREWMQHKMIRQSIQLREYDKDLNYRCGVVKNYDAVEIYG